ncbi:MAG: hypothetical protein PF513_00075, partial [Tenericutes bacterium]|nr:hypothetical protein [Mycoplasmatota bacterium]
MKFNKKLFSLLFVALLALVLVGCNGEDTTTEAPTTEAPTTQTPTTAGPVDFQSAIDHLETEYANTLLSDTFEATEDLTLINSFGDFTFTWSSSNTDYLANDGTISRPLLTEGNQTVVLTVTISQGEESETVDYFVTVKALEEKTPAEIADEVFLFVFAIPNNEFWTSADTLSLVTTGEDNDSNEYTVTWTTSHSEYITTEGVISQPDGVDVDVTLTATITVDSTEFSQDRVFTVAKMAEATEVASIAAAIALGQDAYVRIPGVTVIALYDSGDVFFTDGTDILYIYSPPFDAVVGNVYDLTGSIDFYYNAPQLAGSDTHPLRAADSTAAVTSVTSVVAAGIEDIISATSVPSSEAPHEYIQYEVTASVYYEESWGNYSVFLVPSDYDFDADLATGATQPNGDAIMIYYHSNMDVLEAFHGKEITIDVIMQGYRTDKSDFYANFFGTADDVQLSFANDADAVEAALGLVNFPYSVVESETFDLVTDMYGVTIAYTTSNSTVFNTTTGAIDVAALTVQETITVTATATKGTETDSKTISIKVGPLPTSDISAVLGFSNSDLAKIEGTVVAGGYHGLFFIQDGTDNIALYFDAYSDDYDTWMTLLESNVGNVMVITGEKDTYNGLHQLRVSDATFVEAGTAVTATNIDGLTLDEAGLLAHQGELVELTG